MSKLSKAQDEELIELVYSRPILWNTALEDSNKLMKKEIAWKDIGRIIRKTSFQCKTRWKNIRDHYVRQRRLEKTSGSDPTAIRRRACYWDSLTFLDNVTEEKDKSGNNLQEDSGRNQNEGTVDICSIKTESHALDDEMSIQTENEEIVPQDCQELQSFDNISTSTCAQNQKKRKITNRISVTQEDDEIDLFFKAMAATVRKFEPELILEAKMNVFKTVTDVEAKNLKRMNGPE